MVGRQLARGPRPAWEGAASDRRQQTLALVAVALAVLTWGWSNVAIKTVSTTGLVASFYRLWLAIPVLWLLPAVSARRRRRLDASWLRASAIGGTLFGFHQVLFFTSLKLTSVANVSIIGALQPALVLLVAAPLFGEPVTRSAIGWAAVAVAGTGLVVIGSHGSPGWSPLGDAIAVVNLFAFTAYFLFSKRARARVEATDYVIGMTTVSGLLVLAVCVATRQDLASPTPSDWPVLVGLALVSGTLGHVLTNWAHAHASAFVVSIMLLGVPVLASAGAAAFLGETITPAELVGGAIVLGAIARIVFSARSPATAEELAESAAATDAP
ncbi:MAG TPA: DMT family transporter [Candidatus Binatia bacterium]|nr:DMT family transporter [Candidatus Binatia bacterium]